MNGEKRVSVDIDEKLHRDFKAKCALDEITMKDKIRSLIKGFVGGDNINIE